MPSNWTAQHDLDVVRNIIAITLANRSTFYADPALRDVRENGGNRINQKIQQALKRLCSNYPGAAQLVDEQLKKRGSGGAGSRTVSGRGNAKQCGGGGRGEPDAEAGAGAGAGTGTGSREGRKRPNEASSRVKEEGKERKRYRGVKDEAALDSAESQPV